MAMKFKVEQKGQTFFVMNETTGDVRGKFKTEGEAKVHRDRIQAEHNRAVEQTSSRLADQEQGGD